MKLKNTIEVYKAVCTGNIQNPCEEQFCETMKYGFALDRGVDVATLLEVCQHYNNTKLDSSGLDKFLFSVDDMQNSDITEKVMKQIFHYMSGGNWGKNTVEMSGNTLTVDALRVITLEELHELVEDDLYNNTPLTSERVKAISEIIKDFYFKIDPSKIKNNEFKIYLMDEGLLEDVTGDDVMRYIIYKITGNTMLIKSRTVIYELENHNKHIEVDILLEKYTPQLAQVFNRHKRLILALKSKTNKTTVNKISKLSKTMHVPIQQNIASTFISHFLKMNGYSNKDLKTLIKQVLDSDKITTRDMFKYINLLRVRKQEIENKFYMVRNGKVFYKENKEAWTDRHELIYDTVMESLVSEFRFLKDLRIKYPTNVDYGLPISEKQSVGHLPFGTKITTEDRISAGMYWENNGGANDLDLSTVSLKGERTGWGQVSSYESDRDFLFSGDITNAPSGAIEYMTQNKEQVAPCILINNIYSGNEGSKYKLIVGSTEETKKGRYLDKPIVEIDTSFIAKRSEVLGVIKSNQFIVYRTAVSSSSMSSPRDKAILPYINSKFLTMGELFQKIGVEFEEYEEYDIDLSVENITFDKLKGVFEKK